MGAESQPEPEPSTSRLPPSASTSAVLDFLRIGATLKATPPPRPPPADIQPSVEALAALGIKVRDFAYESVLPPIAPFVRPPPVRRQIQPGHRTLENAAAGPSTAPDARRTLKRTRRDGTEESDLGYGFVMGVARAGPEDGGPKPRKLQRTETEALLLHEGSQPPRRENALLSLDDEIALRTAAYDVFGGLPPYDSQSQSQSQPQGYSQQSQGYSQQSQGFPQSQGNSQDTEPLIATPFVTPNGSLQWIDGEGPNGNVSPPLVPTEPASVQASTSRVLTPPPASPTPAPLRRASPLSLQPLGTPPLPATPPATAAPPLPRTDTGLLTRTLSSLSTLSSPLSEPPPSSAPPAGNAVLPRTPTPAPSPPPRYQLRKRTAPASPVRSPKRRGRPAPRREESLAVVIQS
ncbi:hypothetical protein B0H19DRAFT_1179705 [Mycena capillaripes]|nr:hypothetical protein B0H19DRAFT_1179705 [Mycena capillaripes]